MPSEKEFSSIWYSLKVDTGPLPFIMTRSVPGTCSPILQVAPSLSMSVMTLPICFCGILTLKSYIGSSILTLPSSKALLNP